jgi:hypothetical protein
MMDALRTRAEDVDFHRSRRMFCVMDGEVKVAPEGTAMSHLEWFEAEGWVVAGDAKFIETTIRGRSFRPGTRCSSTEASDSSSTMKSSSRRGAGPQISWPR